MLRALLGRPRTVRVPVDGSKVDVQTVKVSRPSSLIATRFVLAGAITFLTMQGLRYIDSSGARHKRDTFQEDLDKLDDIRKRLDRFTGDEPTGSSDKQGAGYHDKQNGQTRAASSTSAAESIKLPDVIRLPLPIWIRKGIVTPYRPEDTEYKEFVKLQADKQRMGDLRRQVAMTVMEALKNTKRLQSEMKIVSFNGAVSESLDVVPQLFRPSLYHMPSVWISPKSMSIDFFWQPLPQEAGDRIERVFRPYVLYEACRASAKVFFSTTFAIAKAKYNESFGQGKADTSFASKTMITLPSIPAQPDVEIKETPATPQCAQWPISGPPYIPGIKDGQDTRKVHQSIVSAMPYSYAIKQAALTFERVKTARHKLAISTNFKGVCQIRGFVTLHGNRGKVKLEIIAHYVPADNTFLGGIQLKQSYIVADYDAVHNEMERFVKMKQLEAAKSSKNEQKTLVAVPIDETSRSESSKTEKKNK